MLTDSLLLDRLCVCPHRGGFRPARPQARTRDFLTVRQETRRPRRGSDHYRQTRPQAR